VKVVNKEISKYKINIQGLDNKRHEFDFEGSSDFFKAFEQDIIEKGNFKADVLLEKSETMIKLDINIKGSVSLICDRSLEEFDEPIDIHERYVYKFGDGFEVVSEDMEIIPSTETSINLANNFFEYICLAIPMKKLHPSYRNDSNDGDFVYSVSASKAENGAKTKEVDPRWAALENFKKEL
jgi:uncharacterized protein